MQKQYRGLLIASLAINGVYTLVMSIVFFILGARPFGTAAGALCFLAIQAVLVLMLMAGQRLEAATIAVTGGYVIVVGRLLQRLDSMLLDLQMQSGTFPNGLSMGGFAAVQTSATSWLGFSNPVLLLATGFLLAACVARLCDRAKGR